ncbi:MAG: DUF1998 domain-containing protein [Nitrosopumilus sp.]|nr:DUF1998 domain-containing protein [Nitrosopumilus sp.]
MSSEEKEENEQEIENGMVSPGTVRPSQLITNFGPGSVVNMRNDTVMIYGCHLWMNSTEKKKRYKILHHELLQKKLGVNKFRMPISHERTVNVPCFSFPQWGVCKNCGRMHFHDTIPGDDEGFHCKPCVEKKVKKDKCELSHARFAVICPKGHIDEFPWDDWVHYDFKTGTIKKCKHDRPYLFFRNNQKSSALKAYQVECGICHAHRSSAGATERKNFKELGIKCEGKRPWIGPHVQECDLEVKGIQIRATSMWYSINTSAIKVPRWLHHVNRKLENPIDGEKLYGAIELDREDNYSFEEIYTRQERRFKGVLEDIMKEKPEFSEEDAKKEIIGKLEEIFADTVEDDKIPKQIDILNQEFDDFIKLEDTSGKDYENEFELQTSDIDKTRKIFTYVNTVKQVKRITTITALRGFTRDKYPDLINPDNTEFCPITTEKHYKNAKWLPGVQSRGEGIFISLENDIISKWEKDENLQNRCKTIIESFALHSAPKDEKKQKEIQDLFNSKFILLHTLSHLLIKALVAEAGYDEPSLSERIYWSDEKNGILIYATGSSEGSLGGLVRLGQSKLFGNILEDAVEKSIDCSRDPICGEANPVKDKSNQLGKVHQLNGSSCHSCSYVSETSCRFFNQLLDRQTVWNFFKEFLNDE